jgi:hypothetical protein
MSTTTKTAISNITAGMTIKVAGITDIATARVGTPSEDLFARFAAERLAQFGTTLGIDCGSVRKSSPVVTVADIEVTLVRAGKGALRECVLVLTDGRRVVASSRQRVEVVA